MEEMKWCVIRIKNDDYDFEIFENEEESIKNAELTYSRLSNDDKKHYRVLAATIFVDDENNWSVENTDIDNISYDSDVKQIDEIIHDIKGLVIPEDLSELRDEIIIAFGNYQYKGISEIIIGGDDKIWQCYANHKDSPIICIEVGEEGYIIENVWGFQPMKRISINNGNSFTSPENAMKEKEFEIIRHYMDDDLVNEILFNDMPENDFELLKLYLKKSNYDLIIG